MLLTYILCLFFGISLLVVATKNNNKEDSFSYLFHYMGCFIIFVIGLMIMIHGFPYLSSSTNNNAEAYIFAHTLSSQKVIVAGQWVNINFNETYLIKKNINHTYNDSSNDTFTILIPGIYELIFSIKLQDTGITPDSDIGFRILQNGEELKSSYAEVNIDKKDTDRYSIGIAKGNFTTGDKIKFQFTSNSTNVLLKSDQSYSTHDDTAKLDIQKIDETGEQTTTYGYAYDKNIYAQVFGIILCLMGVTLLILQGFKEVKEETEE